VLSHSMINYLLIVTRHGGAIVGDAENEKEKGPQEDIEVRSLLKLKPKNITVFHIKCRYFRHMVLRDKGKRCNWPLAF